MARPANRSQSKKHVLPFKGEVQIDEAYAALDKIDSRDSRDYIMGQTATIEHSRLLPEGETQLAWAMGYTAIAENK